MLFRSVKHHFVVRIHSLNKHRNIENHKKNGLSANSQTPCGRDGGRDLLVAPVEKSLRRRRRPALPKSGGGACCGWGRQSTMATTMVAAVSRIAGQGIEDGGVEAQMTVGSFCVYDGRAISVGGSGRTVSGTANRAYYLSRTKVLQPPVWPVFLSSVPNGPFYDLPWKCS